MDRFHPPSPTAIALGLAALFLSLGSAPVAHANLLNIGVLSFDVLIPGDPITPGVNQFTVSDFTGDPAAGGAALPPDFTVFTPLLWVSPSLTVTGDVNQTIALSAIGPGPFTSNALQFPATTAFSAASFQSTLSVTTFLLANGDTFLADSSDLSASLLPSIGATLVAGTDLAVLQVSGTEISATVPEPSSSALMAILLAALSLRQLCARK